MTTKQKEIEYFRPFTKRLRAKIMDYLSDGTSPEKLSLAIALGVTCGLFPVYGLTTAVSVAVGIVFRANPIVIQLFNYMMYPIYFPIEFGFILTGAWVFEGDLHAYTWESIQLIITGGGLISAFRHIGGALMHAVIIWLIVAPFLSIGLRNLLVPLVKRWQRTEAE